MRNQIPTIQNTGPESADGTRGCLRKCRAWGGKLRWSNRKRRVEWQTVSHLFISNHFLNSSNRRLIRLFNVEVTQPFEHVVLEIRQNRTNLSHTNGLSS